MYVVTLRKVTDRDIPGVVTYVASELTLDRRRHAAARKATLAANIFGERLDANDLCTLDVVLATCVADAERRRKITNLPGAWMLRTNDLDSLADWFTLRNAQALRFA